MLTRLRVRGFKNLVDVDARFGPLTCLAGPNGVGKSNLLDAITFLGLLADKSFAEAAKEVRGGAELRELFTGGAQGRMSFSAEILIPRSGEDDFGQSAEASNTFLRYDLELALEEAGGRERIRLVSEELTYITKGEARARIGFPHKKEWRDSVVLAGSRRTSFIKTEQPEEEGGEVIIRLLPDRINGQRKVQRGGSKAPGFAAGRLPRTVLSSAQNAEENRTAVLLRQEMRRWRVLQLEPTALRTPDDFDGQSRLGTSGQHLPATLYKLAERDSDGRVYAEVANRLAMLVDGVRRVRVDRDDARRVLRFMVEDQSGLELPASALSDGTMRFVALAVLEQDPTETGVICLEEPENGIHPQRVEAMLSLLYDMAVDADETSYEANPLRQVIATTHSPIVAREVFDADLVFARQRHHDLDGRRFRGLGLAGIAKTWRTLHQSTVDRGTLVAYLEAAPSDIALERPPDRRPVRELFQRLRRLPRR